MSTTTTKTTPRKPTKGSPAKKTAGGVKQAKKTVQGVSVRVADAPRTAVGLLKLDLPKRKHHVRIIKSEFTRSYLADPTDRINQIRAGLNADELVRTSDLMRMPRETLYVMLDLPASTIKKKLAAKADLSPEQSERVLGLKRLIGQVEVMVAESGTSEGFDAATWVAGWLERKSPALGGKKPAEFMDTIVGQELVSDLLAKMQSGAYS